MYRRSLRTRVAIAFALCVAILSIIWGFAFFSAIRLSEDRVLQQQLQYAANNYPHVEMNIHGYATRDELPEPLQAWAATNPTEGIYEFSAEELHVAVLPNRDNFSFVVFDVSEIEAASSEDWWLLLVITGVVGVLGVIGFALGIVVMRKAVAPVGRLATAVRDIDLENLSASDHELIEADRFVDDEVGMLAETIEKTLKKIGAFIEKERDFTDSVSHELRTPITIISGAIELLEQSNLSESDLKALQRMKRATFEMNETIEMFLCFAREKNDNLLKENFMVLPAVQCAIDQHQHLLHNKQLNVRVEERATPQIHGHPQAFSIAVSNLVRNAFEHSLEDNNSIVIQIAGDELMITNQANMTKGKSTVFENDTHHGYGIGLGIVRRLCELNGWSFSIQAKEKHVIARLSW